MLILGIDPGTQILGYGLVRKTPGKEVIYVDHGQIKINPKLDFMQRMGLMAHRVSELIDGIKPQISVIEKIFLGRNVDSAFKLGHIRGVCIYESQKVGAEIYEYTPRLVKQGITGSGSATKEQVQVFLASQMRISLAAKGFDASDALALAFYHASIIDLKARFRGSGIDV